MSLACNSPPYSIDLDGNYILHVPADTPIFRGDEYEWEHPLGVGSYGGVHKVRNKESNKCFAIKEKRIWPKDEILKRVYQEIKLAGNLIHPNILTILAVESLPGKVRFLSNLMGMDMDNFHCKDEAILAFVAKQLLEALSYLNQQGIVHRDLKPSNILLSRDCSLIKICDFETSVNVSTHVSPLTDAGVLKYSAPELLDTSLSVKGTYNSDTWSMGLCLLQFYLNRFPIKFKRNDFASVLSQIVFDGEPPTAPPDCSKEFQDFISLCLQRQPNRRASLQKLKEHDFIKLNTTVGRDGKNLDEKYCSKFCLVGNVG
ncbi:mitogen-activated protein kinase kinase 4-like [Coffea arabica]|uniref:mitogen-activated protein kinase kinase n=1 Tax=Coffea arabica TaxID=13443 RepID=A0A6P6SZU1_COFAR|nr:mitogen-activated protein kinase kinase 4-like [Coffea arabica]